MQRQTVVVFGRVKQSLPSEMVIYACYDLSQTWQCVEKGTPTIRHDFISARMLMAWSKLHVSRMLFGKVASLYRANPILETDSLFN